MSPSSHKAALALSMVALFLLSMLPLEHAPTGPLQAVNPSQTTPIGQATKLTIGSWPDGANQRIQVDVPEGHSIKSMDLDLEPSVLPSSLASTLTDVGDFDGNAVYDGMDVNQTSLKILPQDWHYTFESGSFEPEWSTSGSSTWSIITSGSAALTESDRSAA